MLTKKVKPINIIIAVLIFIAIIAYFVVIYESSKNKGYSDLLIYKTKADYTNNLLIDKTIRDFNLDLYSPIADYLKDPLVIRLSSDYVYNSELRNSYEINNLVIIDTTYSEYNEYAKSLFPDSNEMTIEEYKEMINTFAYLYSEAYDLKQIDKEITKYFVNIPILDSDPFLEIYNCKYLQKTIFNQQEDQYKQFMEACLNNVPETSDNYGTTLRNCLDDYEIDSAVNGEEIIKINLNTLVESGDLKRCEKIK